MKPGLNNETLAKENEKAMKTEVANLIEKATPENAKDISNALEETAQKYNITNERIFKEAFNAVKDAPVGKNSGAQFEVIADMYQKVDHTKGYIKENNESLEIVGARAMSVNDTDPSKSDAEKSKANLDISNKIEQLQKDSQAKLQEPEKAVETTPEKALEKEAEKETPELTEAQKLNREIASLKAELATLKKGQGKEDQEKKQEPEKQQEAKEDKGIKIKSPISLQGGMMLGAVIAFTAVTFPPAAVAIAAIAAAAMVANVVGQAIKEGFKKLFSKDDSTKPDAPSEGKTQELTKGKEQEIAKEQSAGKIAELEAKLAAMQDKLGKLTEEGKGQGKEDKEVAKPELSPRAQTVDGPAIEAKADQKKPEVAPKKELEEKKEEPKKQETQEKPAPEAAPKQAESVQQEQQAKQELKDMGPPPPTDLPPPPPPKLPPQNELANIGAALKGMENVGSETPKPQAVQKSAELVAQQQAEAKQNAK